jgi:hypothetical protein
MEGSFNFLGDILLKEQLFDFASLINDYFPQTVSQNAKLKSKLEALSNRQNSWPSEVIQVYRGRMPPLYTSEDIVRLNVSSAAEVFEINKQRLAVCSAFAEKIKIM